MADFELLDSLRLVAGPRLEVTDQFIRTVDPFSATAVPEEYRIEETDVLPGASLVYGAAKRVNARFAASRTLARPQLRELSPFNNAPYFGGYPVQGNPDLELTYITNLDTRFEFFPTLREVLAFSFFYKHFVDPIEEVLRVRTETPYISYDNADGADLMGVELEARKDLEFASPVLKDFAVTANLTLAHSQVKLRDPGIATNPSRPLSNMSPYIVNFSLDYVSQDSRWQARVLYNVHGPRLNTVGLDGMQDIYEEPRHLIDLTVVKGFGEHFELKGNAQNLLFAPVRFTQEGPDGKENLTTRYQPGATFTLTGAYTH
jgi:TonB-dependent receptor